MTTKIAALKALFRRKKVRLKGWLPSTYLMLTSSEKIINQSGNFVDINDYAGEWVLGEEKRAVNKPLSEKQNRALRMLIKMRDTNNKRLSLAIGKNSFYINTVLNNRSGISPENLSKIAVALNVPFSLISNPDIKLSELFAHEDDN